MWSLNASLDVGNPVVVGGCTRGHTKLVATSNNKAEELGAFGCLAYEAVMGRSNDN